MAPHDELDQLSAYVDGELAASDRARIESHLPSCAECRTTLDAIRATVSDLGTLGELVPTEQDSWALRSAIARARTPTKRWQQMAWAAGTAAAAVIAFAVFTQGGSPQRDTAGLEAVRGGADAPGAGSAVPVFAVAENFDALSAQAHLLDVSGKLRGATTQNSKPSTTVPYQSGSSIETGQPLDAELLAANAPTDAIQRCVATATRGSPEALTPFRYELATFEKKPAFLLFFTATDHIEMWIMSRDRCDVLYFGQTR